MREVIKLQANDRPPDHPSTLTSCFNFASRLRDRGKIQEAKEMWRAERPMVARKELLDPITLDTQYQKLLADLEGKP